MSLTAELSSDPYDEWKTSISREEAALDRVAPHKIRKSGSSTCPTSAHQGRNRALQRLEGRLHMLDYDKILLKSYDN